MHETETYGRAMRRAERTETMNGFPTFGRAFARSFRLALLLPALTVLALGCGTNTPAPGAGPETATPSAPREKIVIGAVPGSSPIEMSERLEPLISLMKQKLGVDVQLKFAPDYAQFTRNMASSDYDLAFCAPVQYISAHASAGYMAVLRPVRYGADTYSGIFITTRPDITSIEQLRGRRIAFVDQQSTSGYLFPLGLLAASGIQPRDIQPFFLKGHDNVVLNVLNNQYDAGACYEGAQTRYGGDRAGELRIVGSTEPIYNEPIAMSPKFRDGRAEMAEKVIRFMTSLHDTEEGRAVIEKYGNGVSRFVPATDTDYNSVRTYTAGLPQDILAGSGL